MVNKMKAIKIMQRILNLAVVISIVSAISACNSGNSNTAQSGNNSSWQQINESTSLGTNLVFNAISVSASGAIYVAGSDDVNNGVVFGIYPENNNQWLTIGGGYIPNLNNDVIEVDAMALSNSGMVYAAINNNHSYGSIYSTGLTSTWQLFGSQETPDQGTINSITLDNNISTNVYIATAGYNKNRNTYFGHVYVNNGSSGAWTIIGGESIPNGGIINSLIADNGIIYIGTGGYNQQTESNFGNVYTNLGAANSWQQVGGGSMPDGGTVNSISLNNINNMLFSATSAGNVYTVSLPNGSWQQVGGGVVPDQTAINSINIIANSGQLLAATAAGNLYITNPSVVNSGWQQLCNSSTPDGWAINAIANANNIVYVATQGGNVYQCEIN